MNHDDFPDHGIGIPPLELVERVQGGDSVENYLSSGRQTRVDLESALSGVGQSLRNSRRILDFGCGSGRVLRWLGDLYPSSEVHGVDIDGRAIAWVSEHVPFCNAGQIEPLPPTSYPDASFDLIYAYSVFTHLDERMQDLWLDELRRLLTPGGLAVLSVHGEYVFQSSEPDIARVSSAAADRARTRLSREGILFVDNDVWTGGPFPDYYHTAFHAPWYIFAHWGTRFRVRALIPRGALGTHDWVVLEKIDEKEAREPLRPTVVAPGKASQTTSATPITDLDELRSLVTDDAEQSFRQRRWTAHARHLRRRALAPFVAHQRTLLGRVIDELESGRRQALAGREALEGLLLANAALQGAVQRLGGRVDRIESEMLDAQRERSAHNLAEDENAS